MRVAFALQKATYILQQNINVSENIFATTDSEFVITELVKLKIL